MGKKTPPQATQLVLESTLVSPLFAMADSDPNPLVTVPNPAFDALIAPLGVLPGGPYDYAFVSGRASYPGRIDVGASLDALNGIIATGNGKDTIDLAGSTGDHLVFAGNGIDKATGGLGIDIMFGQNGNDQLQGGGGNDSLDGGNGKDVLEGGTDLGTATVTVTTGLPPVVTMVVGDVLTGGKGPDTFIYALGDGVDRITDFRVGQDELVLEGITQAQLVSTTDGTSLYIGIDDGAGGWVADSLIQVDGVTSLAALLNSQSIQFA
jgi:Ca2+-binding RTX toxin-like protein